MEASNIIIIMLIIPSNSNQCLKTFHIPDIKSLSPRRANVLTSHKSRVILNISETLFASFQPFQRGDVKRGAEDTHAAYDTKHTSTIIAEG